MNVVPCWNKILLMQLLMKTFLALTRQWSSLLASVWGIHRWPVNSPNKGQWRRNLMFSLIYTWTYGWVNNGDTGNLRHNCAHHDVTVMLWMESYYKQIICCPFVHELSTYWLSHWTWNFNSLAPGRYICKLRLEISKTDILILKLISGECHKIPLMISQCWLW